MNLTLPHDVVEDILERLPVKTLVRFKCVSSIWRFTIDSQRFKDRHMIRGRLLEDPEILLLERWDPPKLSIDASLVTLTIESSATPVSYKTQTIPGKANFYRVTQSCDGLVCIYDLENLMCVMNPATRWQRNLSQPVVLQQYRLFRSLIIEFPSLGFGKDNTKGIYKMVWLYKYYNLSHTTCELYSFATNTWKHMIVPPFRILSSERPVYVDGLLYWFIHGNQERDTVMDILCFDLQTESFSVMPYSPVGKTIHPLIKMSSLDNQLCVSVQTSTGVDIWLATNHTWKKAYMIGNAFVPGQFGVQVWSTTPISVLGKKKTKKRNLLVYNWNMEACSLTLFDMTQSERTFSNFCLSFRNGERHCLSPKLNHYLNFDIVN